MDASYVWGNRFMYGEEKPQPFPNIGFNFDISKTLEELTPIAKKYMTELYGKNYGAHRGGGDYGSSLGDARLAAYGADKYLSFLSPLFQTSYNNALQNYQAKYNQALNTYNTQNAWRNRMANYGGRGIMYIEREHNPFTNSMFGNKNNASPIQQTLPQQTGATDPYAMFTPYGQGNTSNTLSSPLPSGAMDYYDYNQRPASSSDYYGRF